MSWWRRFFASSTAPFGGPGDERPGPSVSGLVERFGGVCPVCGEGLGVKPELDWEARRLRRTPSLRLEICNRQDGRSAPGRVSIFGTNLSASSPHFDEQDLKYRYVLCATGHIFLEWAANQNHEVEPEPMYYNMVAVIGVLASGKTYLMTRTLEQRLVDADYFSMADHAVTKIRPYYLSPLEERPLDERRRAYHDMTTAGTAMAATGESKTATPHDILLEAHPAVVPAVGQILRRTGVLLDDQDQPITWGTISRQPLVMRTAAELPNGGGRIRAWNGVADLPGELFDAAGLDSRDVGYLPRYDAVIWVVDPMVVSGVIDRFVSGHERRFVSHQDGGIDEADGSRPTPASLQYDAVLNGSLRPSAEVRGNTKQVRDDRERIQRDIGRVLATEGNPFAGGPGGTQRVLIAVTKCDVLHDALGSGRTLHKFGAPGAVQRGVRTYFELMASKAARATGIAAEAFADSQVRDLLHYVYGAALAATDVRRARADQLAAAIVDGYSDQVAFWDLVHTGRSTDLLIGSGDGMILQRRMLHVPALGAHLVASLRPGAADRLHMRDLVMSALGCGIVCGLGYENDIYTLLHDDGQEVRFFLTSPLAALPVATNHDRMRPAQSSEQFAERDARSAALSQLLLAVLRKART